MANQVCMLEIEKLAGRELTPDEKKALANQIDAWVAKHKAEGDAVSLTDKVMQDVEKFAIDLEAAAAIEKRNSLLNTTSSIPYKILIH